MRLFVLLALAATALAEHPLSKDRTGIRWVYPFKEALEKAKSERRPLLLLPLAGGTNAAGNW